MTPSHPLLVKHHGILRYIAAGGLLLLLWYLFFWRIFTPSAADRLIFNQEGDFILHFYAPIAYQVERWEAGEVPLWNPYNYGGEPSAANIQNGTFYPPRFLAMALAGKGNYSFQVYQQETAWHYWLASMTMFLYLNTLLRRFWPAIIGAVLFAYSSYMTSYPMVQPSTIATEAWFPLALLGAYLSVQRFPIGGTLLATISASLMLLAGRPQAAFYLMIALVAYVIFLTWPHWRAGLWRVVIIGGAATGLAAIQLLPMAEMADHSYRVVSQGYIDKSNGFTPSDFARFFIPSARGDWSPLYIGIVGLYFGMTSLMGRLRPRLVWFWASVGLVALLLSLGGASVVYDAFYVFVPAFNLFRNQERIASLVIFALIMLATYQLTLPAKNTPPRQMRLILYALMSFYGLGYLLATLAFNLNIEKANALKTANILGMPLLVVGLLFLWMRLDLSKGLLLGLVILELFTLGGRTTNFQLDRPENRIQLNPILEPIANIPVEDIRWRVDGAAGLQGHGIYFDIPDIYGLGAISLETPERLYQLPVDRLWEIFSVRYVTAIDALPPDIDMELLAYGQNYTGQEYQLLEIQDPRPIAHLVYDYRQSFDNRLFARQIMADSQVNLREMAVTLKPLPFELPVERPEVSQINDFVIHSPEHMSMRVSTGSDALLTLSIINYPGWQVTIDGKPTEIVEVYDGLIGVPMRAGENQRVEVQFVSDSLRLGAGISAITLLGVVGFGFFSLFRVWSNSKRRTE